MRDYKHLVDRKEPRLISEAVANCWAIMGLSGWIMCIYVLDKFG